MGLIPTSINDGSTARIVALRGQIPSAKSVKTEYFEPGGKLVIQTEFAISPKGQLVQRGVIRLSDQLLVDDVNKSNASVNLSFACDYRHAESEVVKLVTLAIASLPDAASRLAFVRRMP